MDLSNFRETTRVDNKKAGFLHREFTRLKYWILPPTNDKRKERFGQYRDFALFLGVTATVAFFEDRISSLLEINAEELTKGLGA
jgi:hypothetical protein